MPISVTVEGAIATLMIDRPEKRNALDLVCFRDIEAAIERTANSDVRVVVVKAAKSPAFCAGADIGDLHNISAETAAERATYRREVLQQFSELPIPSVAIIDGYALGGGVEFAIACTFRLATVRSQFSFPEIQLGYLPGAGGTQRLPRLIGQTRTLDLMLSGRLVGAEEALRIGLIDRLIEDPAEDARQFVTKLAARSSSAVRAIIAAVRRSELPIKDGLAEEGRFLELLNSTPETNAQVSAFLGKTR